jgi:type I restriction enzyme S subunit
MNAERLLAHYEQIAEAPEAIARLRRFILDLAVRGKIVPQDPKDEPASELLKRIAKEKVRLVKVGEIKEAKLIGMTKGAPLAVPAGWQMVPLGEVINSHLGGGTPSKNNHAYWGGDIRWASVKDVGKHKYLDETIDRITEGGLENSSSNLIPEGNLIVVTRMGLGQLSINRVPVAINQDLRALFLSRLINIDYVYNFFLTYGMEGTGLTVKGIKLEELLGIPFPLPPLAEQRRIVAKVDELMALCDRLEAARAEQEATRDRLAAASLARLNAPDPETFQADARFALDALPALTTRPDQIKRLRQTILNLAVRGKLVPQDPNDEPAAELLKRIAKERAGPQAAKKARRNGQANVANLGADTSLPVGWLFARIDEIALSMRYGTSIKCEYSGPGVPVLRIPNVSGGFVSLDDIKFGPLDDAESRELALISGDLLLIRSNGSLNIVGRSAVVTAEAEGMAFAGYLVRLRLSLANVEPEFVWLAMNSTDVRDQIERPIRSAVGLKNINLTEFGALTIPLPPVVEQNRIVARVDELMALCDRLEASLTAAAATRRRLLDALLAEALVPSEDRELAAAEGDIAAVSNRLKRRGGPVLSTDEIGRLAARGWAGRK